MASRPRRDVVDPNEVGVYHVWSRCVRRARLCGQDPVTGMDYEYRRDWIRDFAEKLAALFAIEIAFRGELSNHLHAVIRNRPDISQSDMLSDDEVVQRWLTITHLAKSKHGETKEISQGQIALEKTKPGRIAVLRRNLADPSWFMWVWCEYVARRCNREDKTSGHFWEERFGARRLLDETSIVVCGVYIDLNQIRAGEADSPETSRHTSVYDRIESLRQRKAALDKGDLVDPMAIPDGWMCPLTIEEGGPAVPLDMLRSATGRRASDKGIISLSIEQYLELLDLSGRVVRKGKSGSIPEELPPILDRLQIKVDRWGDLITNFDDLFKSVVGTAERVRQHSSQVGRAGFRVLPTAAPRSVSWTGLLISTTSKKLFGQPCRRQGNRMVCR